MTSKADNSTGTGGDNHRFVKVSAPGKILLTGGYLVLERPNPGWVVAANQRFYTTVETGPASNTNLIVVHSPQFHSKWIYEYDPTTSSIQPALTNSSMNDFVEKTLRVCLLFLFKEQGEKSPEPSRNSLSLKITIQADNSFYSVLPHLEGNDRTPEAVHALPDFLPVPKDDDGKPVVQKTGLGSSAALTTSLVGALVHYFRPSLAASHRRIPFTAQEVYERRKRREEAEDDEDEEEHDDEEEEDIGAIIHNLAQICHCHALGKVGSGFDVSAACYGTHIYQRFPNSTLPDILNELDHEASMGGTNARSTLDLLVAKTEEWATNMVTPLPLPQGQLQVLLADVRSSTEAKHDESSSSTIKTVLKWKQSKASSPPIPHWNDLKQLNRKVIDLMSQLQTPGELDLDYDALSKLPATEWPKDSPLFLLSETFREIRKHLKGMGEDSGVPIEPDERTQLCDATAALPGVMTCLIPGGGAAGYDALVCVYIDRPTVKSTIGSLWASWESPIVCPLNVKASDEGLRVEEAN